MKKKREKYISLVIPGDENEEAELLETTGNYCGLCVGDLIIVETNDERSGKQWRVKGFNREKKEIWCSGLKGEFTIFLPVDLINVRMIKRRKRIVYSQK